MEVMTKPYNAAGVCYERRSSRTVCRLSGR